MKTSEFKVFKINKDPEKLKFMKTHAFNDIPKYNLNTSKKEKKTINKNKSSIDEKNKDKIKLK